MVGDDIEDQPHPVCAQRGDQAAQGRFAAQFRIDAGRVDHVVAVHGTGARASSGEAYKWLMPSWAK
jgi:hypothetical protein